jgi:hypothetical protein
MGYEYNIAIILSFSAGMNVVVSQVMKLLLMSPFKYVFCMNLSTGEWQHYISTVIYNEICFLPVELFLLFLDFSFSDNKD